MCPGQNESAGKRKSSRLRKGAPWLKTILVQCCRLDAHHQDLGADHFDRRSSEAKARHHVAQLAKLGFRVELQPAAQAA